MGIHYRQFFEYAAEAVKVEDCEFSWRNSMSRSYYAVYHAALTYADSVSVPPVSDFSGPTHRKLSLYFEGSMLADIDTRRNFRRLGYCLKQLHSGRVDADYELGIGIALSKAQDHVSRCGLRLQEFQELLSAQAA